MSFYGDIVSTTPAAKPTPVAKLRQDLWALEHVNKSPDSDTLVYQCRSHAKTLHDLGDHFTARCIEYCAEEMERDAKTLGVEHRHPGKLESPAG